VAQAINVEISGEGTIDGQGAVWWERWRKNVRENPEKRSATDRPRLIYIRESQQVKIHGVSILNSPSFHVVMRDSENIEISHTRIVSPAFSPNTDGIDPINSRHVSITHNFIDCNDDHVAIKADMTRKHQYEFGTSDIYIAHNVLRGGRGISIGSETSSGVSNVLAEHNQFEDSMYGLRIKSPRGKSGQVQNITYRDTTMVNVKVPFVFSGYYQGSPHHAQTLSEKLREGGFVVGDQIYPPESDPSQALTSNKTPQFRNVKVIRMKSTGQSQNAGFIVGVPESEIRDIYFENVFVEAERGLLIRHANVQIQNLNIAVQNGEKLIKQVNSNVNETLKSNAP
jgi:polygalacturonase